MLCFVPTGCGGRELRALCPAAANLSALLYLPFRRMRGVMERTSTRGSERVHHSIYITRSCAAHCHRSFRSPREPVLPFFMATCHLYRPLRLFISFLLPQWASV